MTEPHRLFTPAKIGPLKLRNRTIRAAAFEGMCPGNNPSESLLNYHRSVAAGGIGMTTVAYAAVTQSGLSFTHQLWLRPEVIADLRALTDAVHREGAAAAIQIGHCGNMSKRSVSGVRPIAPSSRINLYAPCWPRAMTKDDMESVAKSFGDAVRHARNAGFDAVEVHAGHGYLISQFLSPYTNRRKDEWGGSFANRSRFMRLVMRRVMDAAAGRTAVLVKMNMRDGFIGGIDIDEGVATAQMIEREGAHALVLSGGFVSKSPMYVMRGAMPVRALVRYMKDPLLAWGVRLFGRFLMPPSPFEEGYFLPDARKVRAAVTLPLVVLGGFTSLAKMNGTLGEGFDCIALARALINEPDFVSRLRSGVCDRARCEHTNYCIAVMYSGEMRCITRCESDRKLL